MFKSNECLRANVLESAVYKNLTSLGKEFSAGEKFLEMLDVFTKYSPNSIPVIHSGESLFVGPALKRGIHIWYSKYGGSLWAKNLVSGRFFNRNIPDGNIDNLINSYIPKIIGADFEEDSGSSIFMFYSPCNASNNKYALV